MVETGKARSVEGSDVTLDPGTICFHADTPVVIALLEGCHAALEQRGILVSRHA
jgi:lactam utilization protein B